MLKFTWGGLILQMPLFSAIGLILLMKPSGSEKSSQLGSNTGHSGGGRNSVYTAMMRVKVLIFHFATTRFSHTYKYRRHTFPPMRQYCMHDRFAKLKKRHNWATGTASSLHRHDCGLQVQTTSKQSSLPHYIRRNLRIMHPKYHTTNALFFRKKKHPWVKFHVVFSLSLRQQWVE